MTFSTDVSVVPPGLLREPLYEGVAVADLHLGLHEGLALLPGEDLGQLLGVLPAEVEPAAEQVGASLGSRLLPSLEGLILKKSNIEMTINSNVLRPIRAYMTEGSGLRRNNLK